jgi:hypothetical protein
MAFKQRVALISVSLLKFALRVGLTTLLIPISSAGEAMTGVMASERANAFFEKDPQSVKRGVASLGSSGAVKKNSGMSTAVTKTSSDADPNLIGNLNPLANTAPKSFPTWVGAGAAPVVPAAPVPPQAIAPAAPTIPSPPIPPAQPPFQPQPTQPMPPVQTYDTPSSPASNPPTYVDDSGHSIQPNPAAKKFTGMSPSDAFPTSKVTQATNGCPDGSCGSQKIPMDKVAGMSPSSVDNGKGPLPHAEAIQASIKYGLSVPRNLCGRAVFKILCHAGLVKGNCNGRSGVNDAKNFGPLLLAKNGWVKDNHVCNRPGVVRIYNGNQSGNRFRNFMQGDISGHIEIFGLDHQYHSFFTSPRSMDQSMDIRYGTSLRRPLQSCWYHP